MGSVIMQSTAGATTLGRMQPPYPGMQGNWVYICLALIQRAAGRASDVHCPCMLLLHRVIAHRPPRSAFSVRPLKSRPLTCFAMAYTACVTGASGYIGIELICQLLGKGYNVNATLRNPEDTSKTAKLLALAEALPGP